jgi:DMSO/TMAO reductase YedYZ molybdopterin-dependent catalytic subunit
MRRGVWVLLLCVFSLLAACSSYAPASSPTATFRPAEPTLTPYPTVDPAACLQPVVVPTMPAVIPGFSELDETTNLHITGFVQIINVEDYRLKISGLVERPYELTYAELRCLPKVTTRTILTCPGNFDDFAAWSGTPLKALLENAGLKPEAESVRLLGADGYEAFMLLDDAMQEYNFLAYE